MASDERPSALPQANDDVALRAQAAALAAALREHGVAVVEGLFAPDLLEQLAAEARDADARGRLQPARVGGGRDLRRLPALRGDRTAWLDADAGPAQARFLNQCDLLRSLLNRSLLLGLESLEAHFAVYGPGQAYARHRDRLRHDDARVVSITCYLNADWQPSDGGALRLYLPDGSLDVLPRLGTCVLFLSAELEHEVLPTGRERWSIAGWFRRRSRG